MRPCITRVVERNFPSAGEIVIDLDGRDDLVGNRRIELVPVIKDSGSGGLGKQRLNLQRNRIEAVGRHDVIREWCTNYQTVNRLVAAWIVNGVLEYRPPRRISAQVAIRQRRTK